MRKTNSNDALEALLYEVLKQPATERMKWLSQQFNHSPETLSEALSLLKAHEDSGDFLESITPLLDTLSAPKNRSGEIIGAFKIDGTIAQGGMGSVYKAHRIDGAYEQIVAIKIVPDTGIQTSLFQAERQILADLNHSAITTILDGGKLEQSDELYFVMEYIEGENVLTYARHQRLSQSARIDLMSELLNALALAHNNGIIHCDLKPDNILIDQGGKLKLLDFGIAHARRITHAAPSSEASIDSSHYAITPLFASPSRLLGRTPVIGDDIYSMGIVMGLLMSGLRISDVKTGTQINKHLINNALSEDARAIFNTATADDIQMRYQSAQQFKEELHAWENNYPISTLKNKVLYRLKKSIQRDHLRWISAALLTSVVLMTAIARWQNIQVKQTKQFNETQVKATTELAKSINHELDDKLALLDGSTPTRLATAEHALTQLKAIYAAQPNNPNIKSALVRAQLLVARILSHPNKLHVGQFNRGRAHLKQAYLLSKEIFESQPTLKNLSLFILANRFVSIQLLIIENKPAAALKIEQALLEVIKQLDVAKDPVIRTRMASQKTTVGRMLIFNNRLEEAGMLFQQAEKLYIQPKPNMSDFARERAQRGMNVTLDAKAVIALLKANYPNVRKFNQTILNRHQGKPLWLDRRRLMYAHHSLACEAMIGQNNMTLAATHLSQAKAISAKLAADFPSAVNTQWMQHRYALANEMAKEIAYSHALSLDQSSLNAIKAHWQQAFQCDNPKLIHMAAPPPQGWPSIQANLDFSFSEVISPIKINPNALKQALKKK